MLWRCADFGLPSSLVSIRPADVSISSARDNTNGTATCLHATPGPVTVTATVQGINGSPMLTGTATLTCN